MCGICGIIRFDGSKVNKVKAQGMLKSLARRGPDNQDSYEKDMIYLGHRRLSIIDISSKSNQPFIDASNKNVIVFNGVIYNYKKIRQRLISYGYKFSSDGDTEVILKSYEHYGKDCIKQLDGVFAFCIYDIERKQFFLARDRLGIKPLYYKYDNNSFSFSSNTEALIDKNNIEIDEASLHYQFTLHSVIPAPRTILKNIKKLEPGHILIVDSNGKQKKENYYSFEHISINKGLTKPEILEETERLLLHSIKKRFYTADVDVGVLLSGGLDSSLIVAMAEKNKLSDINTFSIGFPSLNEEAGDEFYYSDIVSKKFNTQHFKYNIDEDQLYNSLDEVIMMMPEPMVSQDSAAFYLLAKEVSQKQKVVLSGQGADELFGGYFWYNQMLNTNGSESHRFIQHYFDRDHDEYKKIINKKYVNKNYSLDLLNTLFSKQRDDISFIDKVLRIDLSTLIVDDPVKRVDSMTMSWGLETRVPYLDIELVEFLCSIKSDTKFENNGKYYLKKMAEKYLDKELIYREKFYFPVPPLKIIENKFLKYVKNILLSERCLDRGIYNKEHINLLLENPNSNFTKLNGNTLWHLALFERWMQLSIDT